MSRKFRAFSRENIYKKVFKSTSRQRQDNRINKNLRRKTAARINSTPERINTTVENVSVIEQPLQRSDEGLLDQTDESAGSNSIPSEENYQAVHSFPEGAQEDDGEQEDGANEAVQSVGKQNRKKRSWGWNYIHEIDVNTYECSQGGCKQKWEIGGSGVTISNVTKHFMFHHKHIYFLNT